MKTKKFIADSDSKAVAQLKSLKARGYQIASARVVYSRDGNLFFSKADLQEYLESLRG